MDTKLRDPYRSPLWCIKRRCENCVDQKPVDRNVGRCQDKECALWPYRTGHSPKKWPVETHGKKYSPRQAIKRYCLSCCLGSIQERKLCLADDCPLWKWREGTPEEYKGKARGAPYRKKRSVIRQNGYNSVKNG